MAMDDHMVRVHLPFRGDEDFDAFVRLGELLDGAVVRAKVGVLDGNEIGEGEYTIWLYGPDGTALAKVVTDALREVPLPPECFLHVRHGGVEDLEAREETVGLS